MEDEMEWRPIETAPIASEIIVADAGPTNVARAHCSDRWYLGGPLDRFDDLDFQPRWWMPLDTAGNPFRLATPW